MVKIRLRRVGAKKKPSYRLVVADSRAPRDGAFISIIGYYNPLTDPETINIDEEKALTWLKQGAQPTATAARLLVKAGVIEPPKKAKEKPKKAAEKVAEKPKKITEKAEKAEEKSKKVAEKTKKVKEKT